jgi:malate dehydrogenase (oxaloacetate-decarboxylating)
VVRYADNPPPGVGLKLPQGVSRQGCERLIVPISKLPTNPPPVTEQLAQMLIASTRGAERPTQLWGAQLRARARLRARGGNDAPGAAEIDAWRRACTADNRHGVQTRAMPQHPNASYGVTLRIETCGIPGTLGRITTAIGQTGGVIGTIDLVSAQTGTNVRDISVAARDREHEALIIEAVETLDCVRVTEVFDRTFQLHLRGKIEVSPRVSVRTADDLSMVYTPGVGRVCSAIAQDPHKQWSATIKSNTIAVVSDGTAVLGLGDIGPAAAQPVMEGKAVIFKSFAGIDAFPICLATKDPDKIVEVVRAIAPVFGGINLEDIAAPKCFVIEERLRSLLDIPVMHDDQHGTAIVTTAALKNALEVVGKRISTVRIVISGIGASGVAVARMLLAAGARNIVSCDRAGALYQGRSENMNPYKAALAADTNPLSERGSLRDVLGGADVFIGLSGPGLIGPHDVLRMAPDPIVFALANPTPEVQPEDLVGIARVVATGRSDYPNQINNSLAFPGVFRGALDARARDINAGMQLAAAEALASLVADEELNEDYIIPSMFDARVVPTVATAVRGAAFATGVSRLDGPLAEPASDALFSTSAVLADLPHLYART